MSNYIEVILYTKHNTSYRNCQRTLRNSQLNFNKFINFPISGH